MRTFFLFIFLILLICTISLLAANTITGQLTNTPNCPGGHTYAFYRTLEEREKVERMWLKSGFVAVANERVPQSFESSGQPRFLCLRRMTKEELQKYQAGERISVITKGSSI
ncbi:hypothetical protein C4580_05770 [Candidatus Woesearchaeota archaeon]|nr:MAG: hypothetical protein C4580_05770 [Candidatus Woesearchaeota archaeon]